MNILIKDIAAAVWKDGSCVVEKKTICIQGDMITGMDSIPEGFVPDKVIEGKDRLLIPGLVNSHTHAYMSVFRNLADDLSFDDWLFKSIMPIEDRLTGEDAYWGASLSILEMIRTGTTCFADMHMHINETTRAVEESGIRAVIARGLSGGSEDESGIRRLKEAIDEMENYRDCARISFMFGPHAPYSCAPEYLEQVIGKARENNVGIHIHLSESENEIHNMQRERGCTPIELMERIGLFDIPVLAAHCVQLTDSDMDILARRGVSVAINPKSNMKLGNGFARVPEMLERGINVCLGTDGAASNNALNLVGEMNAAALAYKGSTRNAQSVSAAQVFAAATRNGAKGLGLGSVTGTIEVGKKADLSILDLNNPQMRPKRNLISALSYSANGSEVDTVIINGRIIMENRELLTIDEEQVYYNIGKICDKLGITGGNENEQY
ncbi:amidohydrolase [Parasporobacterium paucivorans]|uniref:5-methylthioadenosine/S-adenosylhomocysteine deaminase n=1 Tax=Parasporobacterium paucivorans DSM 15970 TaxID=1122934 RepID=A0A1M6J9J8_9FIRM|nr:amidohydrolase [Parasporobacterium paucivorans]SHJ43368.1 5-methylthioadenosine/S-adenosylhomocysteine deaminase [Parasporobacterium paucivorans DSM 15970]